MVQLLPADPFGLCPAQRQYWDMALFMSMPGIQATLLRASQGIGSGVPSRDDETDRGPAKDLGRLAKEGTHGTIYRIGRSLDYLYGRGAWAVGSQEQRSGRGSAEALWELVQAVRRPSVLVMEEGNQSQWLAEVLSPLVDKMLVVQPEARGDNKTDSLDAFRLAKAARMGDPGKRIYKAPLTLVELRHASKVYMSTKKDLTRARARLKLLLQSRGLLASSADVLKADCRKLWSERLPAEVQPRAQLLGRQIDHARIVHEEARKWMVCAARGIRATHWVQSVPGIGEVRAPMIVAAMISAHRFRTKRQLWRYAGLAVRVESSSDWVLEGGQMKRKRRHGRVLGLNRDRNPVLKEAFVGAAQQIITGMPNHPLHQVYKVRIERGMKPSSARLTLARKIAAIVLAVWKHNKEYDPAQS